MKKIKKLIKNPKKSLFKIAIPIMVGMIVQTMYNVVDTAFVGHLGKDYLAALTYTFPLFFLFLSFSLGINVGLNSYISRKLGGSNKEEAERGIFQAFIIIFLTSFLLLLISFFFMKNFFIMIGAKGNSLRLAIDYFSIFIFAIFVMFFSGIFNTIFSSQGNTKITMKIQVSMLFLNMFLDYIFIYVYNFGIKGAAYATLISVISSLILFIFNFKKSIIKFKIVKLNKKIFKEILIVGIPASFQMFLFSFYVLFLNVFFSNYGVEYVAVLGIVSRLESVAILPVIAISQAILTLIGMIYGAKKYNLLNELSNYTIRITFLISFFIGLLFFIFPEYIIRIFTSDSNMILLSKNYLRIIVFSYPFISLSIIYSRILQAIGHGISALVNPLFRTILIVVPFSYIIVYILNYNYLFIALVIVIASIIASIIGFLLKNYHIKKLNS